MLLKTFDKVNTSVRTSYSVLDADGNGAEWFTVDYLAPEGTPDNILRKLDLIDRGAVVQHVSAYNLDGRGVLLLTVALPKEGRA